jgi:hypothetical protein
MPATSRRPARKPAPELEAGTAAMSLALDPRLRPAAPQRGLITVSIMLATIMQAVESSAGRITSISRNLMP